jgi:hypothetical protein
MRLDIRTQTRNVHIPWSVEVVREYGKPIDLRFEWLDLHVLHVLVLSWNHNTETEVAAQSLSQLFEKLNLISPVLRSTAASLMPRPFPIDVNPTKVPFG